MIFEQKRDETKTMGSLRPFQIAGEFKNIGTGCFVLGMANFVLLVLVVGIGAVFLPPRIVLGLGFIIGLFEMRVEEASCTWPRAAIVAYNDWFRRKIYFPKTNSNM